MSHYIWQNTNWPNFIWDEKKLLSVLSRVRLKQGELLSRVKSLEVNELVKAQAEALVVEAVTTAQIEGEKYDPLLVRSSVYRELGLSYAGLPRAERNIEGLVKVLLDATVNFAQPLTLERLKSWQAALFPSGYSGLKKIRVGEFRKDAAGPMEAVSGAIGQEKIHYQAPPASKLSSIMIDFLSWWKETQDSFDGVIRAGVAHFYFVTIHPFADGNGRIARALTDMALAQDDGLIKRYYSLSNQIIRDKQQYYQILENTQKGKLDLTSWLLWFLESFEQSLYNTDFLLKNIFFKVEFWRKHRAVLMNSRQRKVINKLLDMGKGNFIGGLTTRKYVALTKASRATAYRELNDLLNKKILKLNPGRGRSASYDLA